MRTCQVGVVLAGGSSRRMGRDKAFLTLGGRTLVERQVAKLSPLATEVVISGDPQTFGRFGFAVVPDPPGATGPLAGIAAALARGDALVLAVDLPFVPMPFLANLLNVAGPDGALVDDGDAFQPTAAYYRGKALEAARAQIARGTDLSLRGFLRLLDVRRLTAVEVSGFGDPTRMFWNVNDEESYAMAKAWAGDDPSDPSEA